MAETIRVGRISSIEYETGMVSVYYEDKTASVTAMMPSLSNNEYNMPNVGEMVLVSHLSNDTTQGIVVGTIWNNAKKPEVFGQGIYSKKLIDGIYINATKDDIELKTQSGSFFINKMLKKITELEERIESLEASK